MDFPIVEAGRLFNMKAHDRPSRPNRLTYVNMKVSACLVHSETLSQSRACMKPTDKQPVQQPAPSSKEGRTQLNMLQADA